MKYLVKILIIPLILLTAGTLTMSGQRGMRGARPDTSRLRRYAPEMIKRTDSLRFGMMNRDFLRMHMRNMPQYRYPRYGMNRSFRNERRPGAYFGDRAPGMRFRGIDEFPYMWRSRPGFRAIGDIQGLTEDQKKKMEQLMQQQQTEMQKQYEDMQDKIKELHDSHRSKLRDLLTDEQKEWFDKNNPQPPEK